MPQKPAGEIEEADKRARAEVSEEDGNEQGIGKLIKFLDTIYIKDEMSETWIKYKSFQKVERGKNQEVLAFISDFNCEYNLAKAAGCVYSDTILAF